MERLFTKEKETEITAEFKGFRLKGWSKNKSIETLARKYFCHETTIARTVNAWDGKGA